MNLNDLSKLLVPIRNAVRNTVSRAVVKLVDDSLKFQELQLEILKDETREGVERFQNYGFTSVPLEGAEAMVASVGGRRDHSVVIACDDRRYRVKSLQPGEVAVYTDQGDKVVFKRGGTIEVTASTKVKLLTPLVECTTDLKVAGKLDVTGKGTFSGTVEAAKVLDGGIELGTHTHSVPASGLTTDATIGMAGPATVGGSATSAAPS